MTVLAIEELDGLHCGASDWANSDQVWAFLAIEELDGLHCGVSDGGDLVDVIDISPSKNSMASIAACAAERPSTA